MAKARIVKVNERIAEQVVGGCKKIESGVVGSFQKISDRFVDNFLTKEGETVEEAHIRLAAEEKARRKAGRNK